MESSISGLLLILINVMVSYQGLKDHNFLERYAFRVDKILIEKEYKRLITSGFLHVSWPHLIFNMLTLYSFSYGLETTLGQTGFLSVYFGSLLGGSFFSLFIHRQHGDYSAVGASGAISGIVFACIALFPGMRIGFFGIPFYIPAWVYGLLYVLYSIYGIRSQKDNIGHEAHLGGGLIGLLIAIGMMPDTLFKNYVPILLILVPSCIFIYLIITRPSLLWIDNLFQKQRQLYTLEDTYNIKKREKELELDLLLDKISKKGMDSLSKKEMDKLKQYSENK